MTENVSGEKSKSKTKAIILIALAGLVILLAVGVGASVAMGIVAKKAGTSLLQGVIENQTGVKTDLTDLENGKMTFTDNKTGQQVDIGTGEIPEVFPKDFPVYQGAKVSGSVSGGQSGKGNGFWLTLTTPDAVSKVAEFYKEALKSNGWEVQSTIAMGGATTYAVTKGEMNGSVTISQPEGTSETTILIALGSEASGN